MSKNNYVRRNEENHTPFSRFLKLTRCRGVCAPGDITRVGGNWDLRCRKESHAREKKLWAAAEDGAFSEFSGISGILPLLFLCFGVSEEFV